MLLLAAVVTKWRVSPGTDGDGRLCSALLCYAVLCPFLRELAGPGFSFCPPLAKGYKGLAGASACACAKERLAKEEKGITIDN